MKIFTEKINYGLTAAFELAKNYDKGLIQIKDIANNQNIPQNYLEKLLLDLKKAGLVESVRGAQGGYKLKKAPNKITLITLFEALEGYLKVYNNNSNSELFEMFWNDIEKKFRNLFNITLEDLIIMEKNLYGKLFFQI